MNKLYEMNYAGCHMKVGSLEVIGDISGKGMKSVKKSVEALQAEQREFAMQQEDYWSNLASDGVITPFEKKTLYKEYKEIQQSYNALWNEAVKQRLEGTDYFKAYDKAFNDLKNYITVTISLFNDMESETVIPDREVFDQQFSEYYSTEKFTTLALATGIMGNLGFRVLTSLQEAGTEGEIGLYKGTIYQYTGGTWLPVGLEGYMGIRNELPNAALNQYFIVGETFYVSQLLIINEENLIVNNEDLYINQEFTEGFIYFWDGEYWVKVKDTTDYRYVVAMVDLVNITGKLPGVYQEAIDRATENLIDHIPAYLGPLQNFPDTAYEDDYFVYAGPTIGSHINSDIYTWKNGDWQHVDPADSSKSTMYMDALDDILKLNNAGSEHFAYVFATAFWGHTITTDKLSTRTLYLRAGGYIQSDHTHYDPGRSGLRIDYDGNIDANGSTHIGGSCSINGNTTIGGNCNITGSGTIGAGMKILGDVDVTGAIDTSKDVNIKGNCNITGTGTIGAGMKILGDVDISGKIDTDKDVNIKGNCNITGTGTIGTGMNIQGDISGARGTFSGDIQSTFYNEREGTGYRLEAFTGRVRAQSVYTNTIRPLTQEQVEFTGFTVVTNPIIQKAMIRRYTSMDKIARHMTVLKFPGDTIRANGILELDTGSYAIYGIRGVDPDNCILITLNGDLEIKKSGGYWKYNNTIIKGVICLI